MCGIAGFARAGTGNTLGEGARATLESMNRTLERRGPDGHGVHVEDAVALGHRRLAILDLAGGGQPMTHAGLTVVFNGEIYNYRELAGELGLDLETRSDTEVLLRAFAKLGPDCLPRLNGMFAFALWDPRARTLFAARDRMGKKPFYYAHEGDTLVFASEPKALLEHPLVRRELDPEALCRYLLHEHVPAPRAIFRGMRKLPGGHWLRFDLDRNRLETGPYHELDYTPSAEPEAALARRIGEVLRDSVRRRLVSDVPLGAFLSGGVDSTAVVAAMVELQGPGNVKTFSIGFEDPSYDESAHARFVAKELGTEHRELVCGPDTALSVLPAVEAVLDEPLADASILPTYVLARFTREHVTVALGGDGGDELFCGYDTFRALGAANLWNRLVPRAVTPRVAKLARRVLGVDPRNLSLDFKVLQFLRGVHVPEGERLARWLGAFVPEELPALLSDDLLARVELSGLYSETLEHQRHVQGYDQVTRDLHGFTKGYLQDGVLVKVDRATMACSLEARSPLLDPELVRLAGTVPSAWKREKRIFKAAVRGLVPEPILARPKKGFGVPVASWLRGPLRRSLEETLAPDRLRAAGLFRPEAVATLLREHLAGRANHRKPLWALYVFERWRERWLA